MRPLDITTSCLVALLLAVFTVTFARRASKMTPIDFAEGALCVYLDEMEFATGDLLFYQSCPFINIAVNSVWSHVGIVCVIQGRPYTAEVSSQSGFTLRPVHRAVLAALWDGTARVGVRQASGRRRIDARALRGFLSKHLGRKIPYSHEYWRACFDRTFPMLSVAPAANEAAATTFCSHFVAAALQECGALGRTANAHVLLPGDLAEDTSGFLPTNGHAYTPLTMLRLRSMSPEPYPEPYPKSRLRPPKIP